MPETRVCAELWLDGWVDVTDDLRVSQPVALTRGRSDWANQPDPETARFTLANVDGRYSVDYAPGPWHGLLRRNTPCRVGLAGRDVHLISDGSGSVDIANTPDAAPLDLTGDIEFRVEIRPCSDPLGGVQDRLFSKSSGPAGYRCMFGVDTDDRAPYLQFDWWDSGGTFRFVSTLLPWTALWTRRAYRFTMTASTGAWAWSHSDSIGGAWDPLDSGVFGATSIAVNSAPLRIAGLPSAATGFDGRLYTFELYNAPGGTLVADFDATDRSVGDTTWTDSAGRTWTVYDAVLTDREWRFHGDLISLPSRWELSGNDATAPVEAAGLFRRLKQGAKVLQSPLRRALERDTSGVVGYWPMEQAGDANLAYMGQSIGPHYLARLAGESQPATNTDFACSAPLMELRTGMWRTLVGGAPPGSWTVRFLLSVPAGFAADIELLHIWTGDVQYKLHYYGTGGGTLQVIAWRYGAVANTGSVWGFQLNDTPSRVGLGVEQSGGNVNMHLTGTAAGSTSTGGGTDVFAGVTASRVTEIYLNPLAVDLDTVAFGHLTVEAPYRAGGFEAELAGHAGETASERVARLAAEEGLASRIHGSRFDSTRLGPQRIGTLAQILEEAAATDLGILAGAREKVAIWYRPGSQIHAQTGIELDYSAGEIVGVPDLRRDDNGLANDVTVTNWDGSTARATLDDGPLGTEQPPDGAGRYDTSHAVSIDDPSQLLSHATARLALGTVDRPRLAALTLGAHLPALDAGQTQDVLDVELGDRINVAGLHSTGITGDLPQVVQGISETLETHRHFVGVNATPAEPWDSQLVDGDARYDTAGSSLAAGVAASASSMSVATTDGPIWTTDPADLPFDVIADGVRVTVTAISGGSSPQTFTVTGSTVVRALASGAEVSLADPALYTL